MFLPWGLCGQASDSLAAHHRSIRRDRYASKDLQSAIAARLLVDKIRCSDMIPDEEYLSKALPQDKEHLRVLKRELRNQRQSSDRQQWYAPSPRDSFLFARDSSNNPFIVSRFVETWMPAIGYDFYLVQIPISRTHEISARVIDTLSSQGMPMYIGVVKPHAICLENTFFVAIRNPLLEVDVDLPPAGFDTLYLGRDFCSYHSSMQCLIERAMLSSPESLHDFEWIYELVRFDAFRKYREVGVLADSVSASKNLVKFQVRATGEWVIATVGRDEIVYHLWEDPDNLFPAISSAYKHFFPWDDHYRIEYRSRHGDEYRYAIHRDGQSVLLAQYKKGAVEFKNLRVEILRSQHYWSRSVE